MTSQLICCSASCVTQARMRRPWESDEEYELNKNKKAKEPPPDWEERRQAMREGREVPPPIPAHLESLTPEARAHCMKKGRGSPGFLHPDDEAERSAPCLMAQHGFIEYVDAFKENGYLTAEDLAAADFT